jgi:hypothetical protein
LLEHYDAFRVLAFIACHCTTLSTRGTGFYAMGLCARSHAGRAALARFGWDAPAHSALGTH